MLKNIDKKEQAYTKNTIYKYIIHFINKLNKKFIQHIKKKKKKGLFNNLQKVKATIIIFFALLLLLTKSQLTYKTYLIGAMINSQF